ncbi:hypothetical protein MM300_19425 [Evansella sp. LMS18]|uniref:hypothetical protein n=1 Tax=Evansella sp. LMS18 TaxID=2924033 RepID=UPI0020D1E77B|nr:hypothetical protein [Evansella sp. LMS18]UTR10025.1 hypothetical protein MM300_19425 [Evansella sp. LMS18]
MFLRITNKIVAAIAVFFGIDMLILDSRFELFPDFFIYTTPFIFLLFGIELVIDKRKLTGFVLLFASFIGFLAVIRNLFEALIL